MKNISRAQASTKTPRITPPKGTNNSVASNSGASQSSKSSGQSSGSSGALARLQESEEQGLFLETTGEENYDENYDDDGMMDFDSSKNNNKGEK